MDVFNNRYSSSTIHRTVQNAFLKKLSILILSNQAYLSQQKNTQNFREGFSTAQKIKI